MKLPNRRIQLAVLGLALVALGADRLFLRSDQGVPKQAAGSTVVPVTPIAPEPSVASAGTRGSLLAERLRIAALNEDASLSQVPDLFVLPESWASPPVSADRIKPKISPAKAFAQTHRLTSIMMGPGQASVACVGEKVVHIGQEIDGFTLVNLSAHSAVFEAGEDKVELEMYPKQDR